MNQDNENIDLQRRRTLKMAGALTAGGAIAASPITTLAGSQATDKNTTRDSTGFDKALDEFTVEVQHHWQSNDIALVIRNRGEKPATITHLTPARIELARGTINVGSVLKDGPLTLAAGERITLPLTHHRSNLYNPQAILGGGHFDRSLQRQLRERMTIITDNNALAAFTVAPGPRIA